MATAPDPRKRARQKAREEADAADTVMIVGFGGKMWALRHEDIAPRDLGDMREVLHVGLGELFAAMNTSRIDLDHAAALIFLARRQQNPRITFDEATEGLTLGVGFEVGTGAVADYPPR